MADYQRFYVRQLQRSLQERIVLEINLSDRQVVGGPPVGVDVVKEFGRESIGFHGSGFLVFKRLHLRQTTWVAKGTAKVSM